MLERLGIVLYWLACALAALSAVLGLYLGSLDGNDWTVAVVFLIVAGLAWLTGRACRYILAGH